MQNKVNKVNKVNKANIANKTNKANIGNKAKKRTMIVVCAHNDDQLLGAGGTIRKYVDEGIKVCTYIFSYGETSHPHLRPEIIARTREKESLRAARILGDEIHYFSIKEGHFSTFNPEILKDIIKKKKPFRIFTHSPDDPHPDHKDVLKITKKVIEEIDYKGDFYVFDVWNLFSIKTRDNAKLFVDISDTFKKKIEAFKKHKSQTSTMISLGWSIYVKAIMAGWNNHCKYAELFYRIPFKKK